MAIEENTPPIDWRLLGRQVSDIRLRVGALEGRTGTIERDIKVLLVMAQNHDEALKALAQEIREGFGVISGRLAALEER